MKDAETFIEREAQLRIEAEPFHREWRQISTYMRPMRQEFRSVYYSGELPQKTEPMVTDSTALVAVDNFTGGLFGHLSNPASIWFTVKSHDDDLNEFHAVKQWREVVGRRLHNSYGAGVSPFYDQVPELYADTALFGNGAFFSEYRQGEGRIHDIAYSPFDVLWDINNWGEVDAVYRGFWFTARQALQEFGETAFSEKRLSKIKDKPTERIRMLHVVHPNEDFIPETFGVSGKPYVDVYIDVEEKQAVRNAGRVSLGYQIPRWSGGRKFGFGLGRRNLPDIKTINLMDAGLLEATEWQNHPSVLVADDDAIQRIHPVPRKPIIGGIDRMGRRSVDFLQPNGNVPLTFEVLQSRREQARDAFYFSIMQMLGRTGMTATEILERTEEKMRLMGPHLSRIQTQFLSPSIMDRFAMLWRHGQLPPPPPELEGQDLKIEYESPMAKAQQAAQAQSVLRLVEGTVAVMQVDESARDNINGDAAVKYMQNGFGTPVDVLLSPEQVAEKRANRQQQQAAEASLAMGQQGADIAQKLGVTMQRGESVTQNG